MDSHKLEWVEYDLLEERETIKHATMLRHGGISEKHFFSLNLADNVGDNREHVKANRKRVLDFFDVSTILYPNQTHSANVSVITKENKKTMGVDALVTQEKDIGLAVCHADCQAALFYDPENEAIGACHAGYKGLILNIYKNVVDTMKNEFDTKAENLLVCVSASIGPEHAEYKQYKQEFPEEYWSFQENAHFNFWDLAIKQLTCEGLLEKNIEVTRECTVCNEKDYFSYRREKETGRHATIIALKK